MKEQTLVIIKPDAVRKRIVGKVIERFERAGLDIREMISAKLTKNFTKFFYSHLKSKVPKKLFNSIIDFMTSHYVVLAVLEGKDAVAKARKICGPTNPVKAPKGTIRGDFSNDDMEKNFVKLKATKNIVHSSGSIKEARREIAMFKSFMRL